MNPANEHKSESLASHSCADRNSIQQGWQVIDDESIRYGGPVKWHKVDGVPVIIPGYEEWCFFMHPCIPGDEKYGKINVSVCPTGTCIGRGFDFVDAYQAALYTLQTKGKEAFVARVDEFLKMLNSLKKLEECDASKSD